MSELPKNILIELQYFPSIQYFSKWCLHEQVLIEQWESYTKGSYRNRCHIASANGLQRLSIPLKKGKNEQQLIRDVQISYSENWQHQHWTAIRSAYSKSPFFDFYEDDIRPFFEQKPTFLFDFNQTIFECLLDLIDIQTTLFFSENYLRTVSKNTLDFRNKISPKIQKQVIDHNFEAPKYRQVFEEKLGFLSNLSILDLLFCKGPETLLVLEDCGKTL